MLGSPRNARDRRRRVASAVVAATVALGAAACGGGSAAYQGVVVGTCRGFVSGGSEVRDTALLRRASELWHRQGGAMAQPVPIAPPVGPVCAIDAQRLGGRTLVTLADATHAARYEESVTGLRQIVTSGALPDTAPRVLPVIGIGDGRWRLAAAVASAEVWVGGGSAPPERTTVRPGSTVPVAALTDGYARRHPGGLPHLLLLAHAGGTLYAATGGAPYAASTDEVLATGLGVDDPATVEGWESVLRGWAVPQVAQVVAATRGGAQAPGRVDRLVRLVGTAESRAVGTVLVVIEEPDDGSHLAPQVVDVVQRRALGAESTPVGAVVSASGSWSGSAWLDPVQPGAADPRRLVVMGNPGAGAAGLTLEVTLGPRTVAVSGRGAFVALVAADDDPAAAAHPDVVLDGRSPGRLVLPLGPLP